MRKYCLDTSFLINGWNKYYRVDVFPQLWDSLGGLITSDVVIICREVFKEVNRQDDGLSAWAKQFRSFVREPNSDQLERMRDLMRELPNFAALAGTTNAADPWVITLAQVENAIVVTDEQTQAAARDTKPPKIPYACEKVGVAWLPPIDFLSEVLRPAGDSN